MNDNSVASSFHPQFWKKIVSKYRTQTFTKDLRKAEKMYKVDTKPFLDVLEIFLYYKPNHQRKTEDYMKGLKIFDEK